jgi:hypothetical protein
MAQGGARNRSGPPPDETSARSDARGYTLTALPSEGYDGEIPEWPLAAQPNAAELSAWEWAWRTPQACAWSTKSESWRRPFVAQWARLHVRCSEPDAPATCSPRCSGSRTASASRPPAWPRWAGRCRGRRDRGQARREKARAQAHLVARPHEGRQGQWSLTSRPSTSRRSASWPRTGSRRTARCRRVTTWAPAGPRRLAAVVHGQPLPGQAGIEFDPVRPMLAPAFHYRRSVIVGPQKNGKSPWGGVDPALRGGRPVHLRRLGCRRRGLPLLRARLRLRLRVLLRAGRPDGDAARKSLIQMLATAETQTANVYEPMQTMIRSGPLDEILKVREGFIRTPNNGKIEPVSAAAGRSWVTRSTPASATSRGSTRRRTSSCRPGRRCAAASPAWVAARSRSRTRGTRWSPRRRSRRSSRGGPTSSALPQAAGRPVVREQARAAQDPPVRLRRRPVGRRPRSTPRLPSSSRPTRRRPSGSSATGSCRASGRT